MLHDRGSVRSRAPRPQPRHERIVGAVGREQQLGCGKLAVEVPLAWPMLEISHIKRARLCRDVGLP